MVYWQLYWNLSLSPCRSTISRGCIISAETSHIATNGPVFSVGQIMVTTGKWDRVRKMEEIHP